MYVKLRKLFSYCKFFIYIIIGGRGCGKTFGVKKLVLKDFFYKNKKFAWIVSNESMCDELKQFDGYKFYEDIKNAKIFPFDFELKITNENTILICKNPKNENKVWVHCGYLIALSSFHKLKGNAFSEIKNVCIDEFIQEKNERKIGNKVAQFINTIENIGRTRKDFRIIMMSNALDKGDRILNLFFSNIKGFGYYFNKQKKCVLYYCENSEDYKKIHGESISGVIVKGTSFEENILYNAFDNIDNMLFSSLPNNAKRLISLKDIDCYLNLYSDTNFVYVKTSYKKPNSRIYSNNIKNVGNESMLISKELLNKLRSMYGMKRILFETGYCKNIFVEFIK